MKAWVTFESPWGAHDPQHDETGKYYVALVNLYLLPPDGSKYRLRFLMDGGHERVIGATSDGSGADLSQREAEAIARALTAVANTPELT